MSLILTNNTSTACILTIALQGFIPLARSSSQASLASLLDLPYNHWASIAPLLTSLPVLCIVIMQDFNPLARSSSQASLASLPDLPHHQWTSSEGRRQLHDHQLLQQQHGVLVSRGQGTVQPRPKAAGAGSGQSLIDSQVRLYLLNVIWIIR
jgi:hypothetical protein